MPDPVVSVIMANYNTPKGYFKEAIDSVIAQTLTEWELLIIDDCSTDDSLSVAEGYNDERIKVIKNQTNSGPAVTRNNGFKAARGKYIAILDSDDIALPDRLKKQVEYMDNDPELIACGTWFEKFGDINIVRRPVIEDFEMYRCQLLFSNTPISICNSSSIVRRDLMNKYDICYDTDLKSAEDYDFWVQCSRVGKMDIINDILVRYRTHAAQISQAGRSLQNEYADFISQRQLETLGVKQKMLSGKWRMGQIENKRQFDDFYRWIGEIKSANEINHLFDQKKLTAYTDKLLKRALLSQGKAFTFLQAVKSPQTVGKDIFRIVRGATL